MKYRVLLAILLAAAPAAAQSVIDRTPAANVITLLGRPLNDREGVEIGRLVDIVASPNGQPRAAIADVGGFLGIGTRRIAIDWALLRFHRDRGDWVISVDATGEAVAAAPEYPGTTGDIPILAAAP